MRKRREERETKREEENEEEREERERKRNLKGCSGFEFETRIYSVFRFFEKSFVLRQNFDF